MQDNEQDQNKEMYRKTSHQEAKWKRDDRQEENINGIIWQRDRQNDRRTE